VETRKLEENGGKQGRMRKKIKGKKKFVVLKLKKHWGGKRRESGNNKPGEETGWLGGSRFSARRGHGPRIKSGEKARL